MEKNLHSVPYSPCYSLEIYSSLDRAGCRHSNVLQNSLVDAGNCNESWDRKKQVFLYF